MVIQVHRWLDELALDGCVSDPLIPVTLIVSQPITRQGEQWLDQLVKISGTQSLLASMQSISGRSCSWTNDPQVHGSW